MFFKVWVNVRAELKEEIVPRIVFPDSDTSQSVSSSDFPSIKTAQDDADYAANEEIISEIEKAAQETEAACDALQDSLDLAESRISEANKALAQAREDAADQFRLPEREESTLQ